VKQVVILTTGGTIAMRHDDAAGGAVPALAAAEYQAAVASLPVSLSVDAVCNLPSAHFTLDTLWEIQRRVAQHLKSPDVDGIVVTHGTDVLEETAMLLDLTVDSSKPIVLTGAMRTASDAGFDGFANLTGAVRVAASESAHGLGTLVLLNDTVHAARYVTKSNTQSTDTFQSPGWGPLGRVDSEGLQVVWRLSRRAFLTPMLESRVELIKLTVGMQPDLLCNTLGRGTRGVVLEALGGGRVPPWWLPHIRSAVAEGVTIVVASRCPGGRVGDRYGYAGAQRDLRSAGCFPAGCLNGQKSRIALMVVLGAGLKESALWSAWQRIAEPGEHEPAALVEDTSPGVSCPCS